VGVLYVNFFSASHHFTDDEKRVLRIIADQAAVAIHTIGGLHDAKRQLETVLQAISAAKEAPTLDQLLQTYLEFSLKEVEAESGTIQLLDPSAEALTIEARVGDVSNRKYESITVEQGITGRAVREQRLIYVPDVTSDPQYLGYFGNMQSEMAVPLVVNDVPLGVLNAEHSRQGAFDLYKRRLFELFASQAAVLINERIKLEEAHHQKLQTELDANAAQMTRHMTHRMKNYLGSARLSLRKVTDKASLSAEHRQELKEADSRMVRCAVIVAELFKPYRRARKIKVTVESLICGATDRLVKLPGTEISILLPDALPTVKVEVNAAIDYFYELLTNATRFAQARLKEGGISKGEIQITGRVQDEKWVEVLFTNNGPPIPKKRWQVIFQQFSGFPDEDENPEHFGLGLWGARTFFRRQGGTVRVLESAEDHTTFVVRLPAAE
jgi:signal transduction histidine kinase